ncbi:MAG: hypothetical protein AAGD01_03575 [Acidobacteriota bacterium]
MTLNSHFPLRHHPPRRRRMPMGIAAALAALVLVAASPASTAEAQTQRSVENAGPAISELRIALQDMKTKEELGYVVPGEALTLAPGDSVRLRLVAIPGAENRAPRYPSAEFSVLAGKESIRVSRVNAKEGSAVLDAVRPSGKDALVRYEIREPLNIRKGLLQGTITVRVEDSGNQSGNQNEGPVGNDVEAVVDALYQGILLREPDPAGAREARERITEAGYGEVVRRAEAMGNSGESRDLAVSDSDRLEALYNHLLGQSSGDLDRQTVNEDLAAIRSGRLGEVAKDLVRSQTFRDRFGYTRRFQRY